MSMLEQYLKSNKEKAYELATANTHYDEQGRPTISKDDEWVDEIEWDELFEELKDKKEQGK